MMVTERKEMFTEELTLLKKIQKYGKEYSTGKLEKRVMLPKGAAG